MAGFVNDSFSDSKSLVSIVSSFFKGNGMLFQMSSTSVLKLISVFSLGVSSKVKFGGSLIFHLLWLEYRSFFIISKHLNDIVLGLFELSLKIDSLVGFLFNLFTVFSLRIGGFNV